MGHRWVPINEYQSFCPHCDTVKLTNTVIESQCTPKVHLADSDDAMSAWDLAKLYGFDQPPSPTDLERAIFSAESDGWRRVGTSNVPPNQGYMMWYRAERTC